MNIPLLLAEKVAASVCIGLLIGLEREWAHKEAGIRSFTITALLGTLAWLVEPTLAIIEVGVVVVIIVLVNIYSLREKQPLQITTSLALATTNVLGILVGGGSFFLAFACAIVVTAFLSWKTEIVAFTSKLTVVEIRGTLLMGFISAVVYPLLPDGYVDQWKLINPRSIWLTVIIVSALSFLNYALLRQFGMKGMRYSAILGGLVNSAAVAILLGDELKNDADTAQTLPTNFLLADVAMIFRNAGLLVIFSWAVGPMASIDTVILLGPMMALAAILALFNLLLAEKKSQQPRHPIPLRSPLELRSVLRFTVLFFSLTVFSGLGEIAFGAVGFLVVVVVGALASAASSAVLVGTHVQMHAMAPGSAAVALYLASVVGLIENVVIIYAVTRNRTMAARLSLLTLPIVCVGGLALGLALFFHW